MVHAPHDYVLGHRLGVLAGGPIAAAQELRFGGAVCPGGQGLSALRAVLGRGPRLYRFHLFLFPFRVSVGPRVGIPRLPALELVVLVSEAGAALLERIAFRAFACTGKCCGGLADDRVGGAVFTVGGPSMMCPGAGLMMLGVGMVVAWRQGQSNSCSRGFAELSGCR